MSSCIFCKIANKEIPSEFLYEDERVFVVRDLHPKAPIHILVIPKRHIASLIDLQDSDRDLATHLLFTLPKIAVAHGLVKGFRTIINSGVGGGQEISHLHCHLIGISSVYGPTAGS